MLSRLSRFGVWRSFVRSYSAPAALEKDKALVVPTISLPTRKYLWGEEHEDDLQDLLSQPTFRINFHDIENAKSAIRHRLGMTALTYSPRLSKKTGTRLFLKKEHTLFTGSFKERGVLNKLLHLSPEEKQAGVVCASSGNLGLAVAHHSTQLKLGGGATVVFPFNTYNTQIQNTLAYGGKVVFWGDSFPEAYQKAQEIAKTEKRTLIASGNDKMVCAGYGTAALDLIEQNPYLDAVIVPVGGGSLLASLAFAIKNVNPRIKIFGVESERNPALYNALYKLPPPTHKNEIPGHGLTPFEALKQNVDGVLLVSESDRAYAILTLMELEKTVVQGSGVASLAALMNANDFSKSLSDKQIALVTTGGNIESSLLARVIDKGLVKDGRLCRVRVSVEDRPGQASALCKLVAAARANVRDVYHERAFGADDVGYTQVVFTLETRSFDHVTELLNLLKANGFDKADLYQ